VDPIFEIPLLVLPKIEEIETISIPLPTADVPFYTPMVVPPSDLQAEEEITAEESGEEKETKKPEQPGMIKVDIPFTDKQMPVPETEILVTATTTAVVSVAATLTATAAFKYTVTAMKPILKTAWKKMTKGNGSTTE
tara:strand:+ start:138 stop:548 length:411 start_codon:yes stop_codon:yes gene_type:complete